MKENSTQPNTNSRIRLHQYVWLFLSLSFQHAKMRDANTRPRKVGNGRPLEFLKDCRATTLLGLFKEYVLIVRVDLSESHSYSLSVELVSLTIASL